MRGTLTLVLAIVVICGVRPSAAQAYSAVDTNKSFDTCAAKTQSQMQTWWDQSPYYNTIAYIGGANRSCAQQYLTSSWVASVHTQGWGLLPTWVGRQAPDSCNPNGYATYISTNTTTARSEGIQEATSAYNAASALGMDLSKVPLLYDLEGYSGGTTCRAAVKAFLDGWDDYLFKEPGETFGVDAKPGVYGSGCSSFIDDFWSIANRPVFVWFAWWNGNKSTTNIPSCMNASHWPGQLRHKQYVNGHDESWGGLIFHIDNDCSYGPVYDNVSNLLGDCG